MCAEVKPKRQRRMSSTSWEESNKHLTFVVGCQVIASNVMGVVSKTQLLAFCALFFFWSCHLFGSELLLVCWSCCSQTQERVLFEGSIGGEEISYLRNCIWISLKSLYLFWWPLATNWLHHVTLNSLDVLHVLPPVLSESACDPPRSFPGTSLEVSVRRSHVLVRVLVRVCLFLQNHYCGYCRRVLSMVSQWFCCM